MDQLWQQILCELETVPSFLQGCWISIWQLVRWQNRYEVQGENNGSASEKKSSIGKNTHNKSIRVIKEKHFQNGLITCLHICKKNALINTKMMVRVNRKATL